MKKLFRFGLACASLLLGFVPLAAHAQVVINEVLADNQTAFNNDGDFSDYVEIYNNNAFAADISGWRLTDKLTSPTNFTFSAGTVIPAQGFLLVFCDNNTTSPGIHTGFGLKSHDVQQVGLFNAANPPALKDSVTFGFQVTDKSIGRVPDGTGGFILGKPSPGRYNTPVPLGVRSKLRINEWMPLTGPDVINVDPDWFEIFNLDTNAVSISGIVFSDQLYNPATNRALPALSFIGARGFLKLIADEKLDKGPDHVDFKLSSTFGDQILLWAPNRTNLIHRIGFTNATLNVSQGWLPDGNTTAPIADTNMVVYFPVGRDTPGDSNLLPIPQVVINEVLTHTDPPLEDAIELHNVTGTNVNIGNWWLSNSPDDYAKFRIPAGTTIAPFGFVVFYEYAGLPGGFNPNGQGTGTSFTLNSAHGDQCLLFAANSTGGLTGYRRSVDFPSSENGVSFGRYTTSSGEIDFVPMKRLTFGTSVTRDDPPEYLSIFRTGQGATNARPKIGPLVISEIMYHPPDIISGTNKIDNDLDEYVEIYNAGTNRVYLYDTAVYDYPPYGNAYTNTWHLAGDVDFEFPTNLFLGPGRALLVVNFSPTNTGQLNAFKAKYGVPANVQIFGPYSSKLGNGGSTVRIERPDAPQSPAHPDFGFVPYLWVDWVKYNDKDPWPTQPDGHGAALYRLTPEQYGNDPINWGSGIPTPGWVPVTLYPLQRSGNTLTIDFYGTAGSGYTVLVSSDLSNWSKLTDVPPDDNSGTRQVTANVVSNAVRFYRIVTPIQP